MKVNPMTDYRESVLTESFNDAITSFDQYVQESALLIGGIIAGVIAFITLMILFIKQFIFKKKYTAEGQNDSLMGYFEKLKRYLRKTNKTDKIVVYQGFDLNQVPGDPKDFESILNTMNKYMDNLEAGKEVLAQGSDIYDVKNGQWSKVSVKKTSSAQIMDNIKSKMHKVIYSNAELQQFCDKRIDGYKRIADRLKALDKRVKSFNKKDSIDEQNRKTLTQFYDGFVNAMNNDKMGIHEWYHNIVSGISESDLHTNDSRE